MKRTFISVVVGVLVLTASLSSSSQSARAQSPQSYSYSHGYSAQPSYVGPVWNYPQYGAGSGNFASTYEAGVLSGMGNLYRGVGEYNVANSVAAYNLQLARNAALRNNIAERQARANVYASMHAGQERRRQENSKKNEAVAQFHAKEQSAVLAASQIDRQNGEVKWPAALKDARFGSHRTQIESAITQQESPNSSIHQISYAKKNANSDLAFEQIVREIRAELVTHKDDYRPSDYAAARAFLDRLKNEKSTNTTSPSNSLARSL